MRIDDFSFWKDYEENGYSEPPKHFCAVAHLVYSDAPKECVVSSY